MSDAPVHDAPVNDAPVNDAPNDAPAVSDTAAAETKNIDPATLPPELAGIYKSMQADYTRKTQKLAEERKALAAAQREPDAAGVDDAPAADDDEAALLDAAKDIIAAEYGDFDPDNPAHNLLAADMANTLSRKMQASVEARRQILDAAKGEPRAAEVDAVAARMFAELSEAERAVIRDETANGNVGPALALWQSARRAFYGEKSRRTPTPPKAAPAGTGSAPAAPAIAPSDFRTMSDDDKAKALVKLGLA